MGLAALEVTGTEKQGLGFCLIVEGKIWPAKINDPGSQTFTRNTLSATHSKTLDFKQDKFEELAEPLTQDLVTFFDPTLAEQFDIIETAGATKKRDIYLMYPRLPLKDGEVVRENAFIFLPEGFIAADSIAIPLDNFMTQAVGITGGTANPTIEKEFDPTVFLPATVVTFTPLISLVGPIPAGTRVGILTTDIAQTDDVSLFFDLAGTDAADFTLDGKYVVAATILTNTGGTGTGDYKIDVTTSDLVGFDDEITALQYTETDLAVDIT